MVSNPAAEIFSAYEPIGRSGYTKMPLSLVTVSRLMPVFVSVSVTAALQWQRRWGRSPCRGYCLWIAEGAGCSAQREEHCEAGE